MAHFYSLIRGMRGESTRCGSKKGGVKAIAAGWRGAIDTYIYRNDDDTEDLFRVCLTPWENSGGKAIVIAEGVLNANRQPKQHPFII